MQTEQGTVYLAGPIAGLTQLQATRWRSEAAALLSFHGLRALRPLIPVANDSFVIPPLASERRIPPAEVFNFDLRMVRDADAILVGYPTGPVSSVGTAVEVGYALGLNKPIVLWTASVPGIQEDLHPFIKFAAAEMHDSLEAAVRGVVRCCKVKSLEWGTPPVCDRSPAAGGLKHDDEKLPMGLMPRSALEQVAAVLAHGAHKYSAHNWRKGISVQRNIDAALRHIVAANEGENLDADSGLPHFAHAICDLMFVIETLRARPDLDDRYHREETMT